MITIWKEPLIDNSIRYGVENETPKCIHECECKCHGGMGNFCECFGTMFGSKLNMSRYQRFDNIGIKPAEIREGCTL